MPRCQNESCQKTGLSPKDVTYNRDINKVLCNSCNERLLLSTTETSTVDLKYSVSFGNEDGLRAKVKIGDVELEAHAPYNKILRLVTNE